MGAGARRAVAGTVRLEADADRVESSAARGRGGVRVTVGREVRDAGVEGELGV